MVASHVSDGIWHYLKWSRRYSHVNVTVDGITKEGDLPGPQRAVLNVAHDNVTYVHIGGFPDSLSLPKGKSHKFTSFSFALLHSSEEKSIMCPEWESNPRLRVTSQAC